jgi:hypothetical protein
MTTARIGSMCRLLSICASVLAVTAHTVAWSEEASPPSDQGPVQERGIISPAIKGLTPADSSPGQELKDLTILRGFRRYWIDRLELTPPEFVMGQALEQARVWYHCRPNCLGVDRVGGVTLEIHHRQQGTGTPIMIAMDRPLTLMPGGGGCPPGGAIPNAGCVTLLINPSFRTAPGVFEVTLIKEQDRINRAFPIVPVGDGRRFRAGGQ